MCDGNRSRQGVTAKVDIWAFGAVFINMITGAMPWAGMTVQQIITNVLVLKKPVPVPAGLPAALGDLLQRCFAFDPAQRPTAAQVRTLAAMPDPFLGAGGNFV